MIYRILTFLTICLPALCLKSYNFHKLRSTSLSPINHEVKSHLNRKSNYELHLASPLLSLDKIVIPQYDRTVLFKLGIIFLVTSVMSFTIRMFQFQINNYSTVLTNSINKLKSLLRFKKDARVLDLKTWQTTLLSKVISLNDDYVMLQFDLPTKSLFDLEVDLGQELQACFLDDKGKAVVGSILPLVMDDIKNKFFCIIKKADDIDSNPFHEALFKLSEGDEIAIKGGTRQLSEGAKYCDPIKYITLVSSSLGIAPSLSLLQSLRDESSVVEGLTLIWMNRETDDFICDDIVQKIVDQSKGKISVHRFINNNMEDTEILFSDDIADLIRPYQRGNVVMLCGSEKFTNVMKDGFSDYGYAKENLLIIKA